MVDSKMERQDFMRRWFTACAVMFAVAISAAVLSAASADSNQYPEISIKQLKTAMANKSVTLIDANGTDSYKDGHIPGAIDFEAHPNDLAKLLPKDKHALIVAYCGGPQCMAYRAAAKKAVELGYTNVQHLVAGISGWEKAGEKMEKGEKSNKAA